MNENRNIPRMRFPEYIDSWENIAFGSLVQRKSKTQNASSNLPSVEYDDVEPEIGQLNKEVYSKQSSKKGIEFDDKDVLYGKLRPYLHHWLAPSFKGVATGDWWVLTPKNTDRGFIYSIIQTDEYDAIANQSSGSKMPRSDWNTVARKEFAVPSDIKEQQRIGSFFSKIDSVIVLQQQYVDQLKEFKKGCLQKMFPKKGEKVPEMRFPGFTDYWEQRKLNEYLEVSRTKNKDEVFGKEDVLSVSGDYGIVNQIEFQGRSFAGASVAPYGVVETGDVVYTKSPLKSNPYGIIKTNKGKPGIVSTLYAVYKPLDNVYSEFVQIYFEQDARMNNYMHPLVNKGAKNDMKVSDENALKGEVCFPNRDEQVKISEYFAKLDNLITLHQRKLDEMKEFKKGCLQKMFV